jgi:LCP family protein required for cell wall assembly
MRFLKWIVLVATVVWGCAWLQGPAFRESAHALQVSDFDLEAHASAPDSASLSSGSHGLTTPLESEPTDGSKGPALDSEAQPFSPLPEPRQGETPPLSETTNVLILGLDKKPGQKGFGRPDTLVVAALSHAQSQLGLISIPRDLYVDIEGHGPDRINTAFSVALNNKQDPTELTKRVIEDTLGLPILHTVAVDLGAFEALVDALGGVSVLVPCPIYDNFIDPRTQSGRRILDVEAGVVPMDGITAGLYARSRHGRSDWNRARRQQAILLGIKRKFMSMDGLFRMSEVVATLEKHVRSDMSRAQMLSLGAQVARLAPTDIHGLVLGSKEAVPTHLDDGKQVLVPDHVAIAAALSRLFSAPAPGTEPKFAKCFEKDAAIKGR